jgi:hypothetical protein
MNVVFSDEEVKLLGRSRWRVAHNKRFTWFVIAFMFLFGGGVLIAGEYFRTEIASLIVASTIAAGMAFAYTYLIGDPSKKYADDFLKRIRGDIPTDLEVGEKHETG